MGIPKIKDLIRNRREDRLKRIAKRILRKKARPEEFKIFEELKEDLLIKEVLYNPYTREMEFIHKKFLG